MIPPLVSTRTDPPLQQGFAVQDKELIETSIGTFVGRERERVSAQKWREKTNHEGCTKGPYICMRGRPKRRGEEKSQGTPSLTMQPHQGRGRAHDGHSTFHLHAL
jgi:hypothetical protein